jgi:hypothetical protein
MFDPRRAAAFALTRHSGRRLLVRIRSSGKLTKSGRTAQGWQGLEPVVVVDLTSAAAC